MLGGLAEFERELIRARTGEGRKRAQERGVRFGRPAALTSHQRHEARQRLSQGDAQAEAGLNVPRWRERRNRNAPCSLLGQVTNGTGHESAVRLKGRAAKLPGGLLLGSGRREPSGISPPKPCMNRAINALHGVNGMRVPLGTSALLACSYVRRGKQKGAAHVD